jgi:predicted nucleic acid-binding protein
LLRTVQRGGHAVGAMDLLIATAAVVDAAPLVTGNVKEFRRVPGLDLIEY